MTIDNLVTKQTCTPITEPKNPKVDKRSCRTLSTPTPSVKQRPVS